MPAITVPIGENVYEMYHSISGKGENLIYGDILGVSFMFTQRNEITGNQWFSESYNPNLPLTLAFSAVRFDARVSDDLSRTCVIPVHKIPEEVVYTLVLFDIISKSQLEEYGFEKFKSRIFCRPTFCF